MSLPYTHILLLGLFVARQHLLKTNITLLKVSLPDTPVSLCLSSGLLSTGMFVSYNNPLLLLVTCHTLASPLHVKCSWGKCKFEILSKILTSGNVFWLTFNILL